MLKGEIPDFKKSASKMIVGAEDKLNSASVGYIFRTGPKLMLTLPGSAHCHVLSNSHSSRELTVLCVVAACSYVHTIYVCRIRRRKK